MRIDARRLVTVAAIAGGLFFGFSAKALADGFLEKMMNVLGITANPGQLKGESDTSAGQLWVTDLELGTQAPLTADSNYRWPVYEPGGESLIALKGDDVVRISTAKGKTVASVLKKVQGIDKLVGFDRSDSDKVLVLVDKSRAPLALLSLKTGNLTALPYDPKADGHRAMLSHARSEERVYGTTRLKVERQSKKSMEGTLEWTDVLLQFGSAPTRNVSNCDGISCGQPSLSPDSKRVAYVRAAAN